MARYIIVFKIKVFEFCQNYRTLWLTPLQFVFFFSEEFKKVYMLLYNVFMFVGFLYIASVLGVKYLKDGADFYPKTYDTISGTVNILQFAQFLEVLHCTVGYTKGNWFTAFTQIFGRNFLLLSCYKLEPKEQQSSVVFYLFLTWSLVEIIR